MNLDIANNMRQVSARDRGLAATATDSHFDSPSLSSPHPHTLTPTQTPLHLAVITRQPHMVQALVAAGASVNFPDRKGNTSLHLAAQRRDVRILQLLSRATSPLPDFNLKNFSGREWC